MWKFQTILQRGTGWLNEFCREDPGGSMSQVVGLPNNSYKSSSPIRRGFAPGFVDYKKGYTRLAVASDKVYQLLVHGRWLSPGTPASSTTKTDRHYIAEILLKVALSTINLSINQSISILYMNTSTFYLKKYIWILWYQSILCKRRHEYENSSVYPSLRHGYLSDS